MCFLKKFERVSTVPVSKAVILDDTDAYSSDESVLGQKNDDMFYASQKISTTPTKQNNQQMLDLIELLLEKKFEDEKPTYYSFYKHILAFTDVLYLRKRKR